LAKISVKELLEAGVHYGHRTSRWNPKMEPYIFGKRNGIHIIDLRQTVRGIIRASRFLGQLASEGKPILFVGTKRQAAAVVREEVAQRGLPYVADRWLGGMLTNFRTVRRSLGRLEELEALEETGEINSFSKKMISTLQREKRKILRNLQGVRHLESQPAAMVIIDPRRDKNAVLEAVKLGIPIVGVLDTDCDPGKINITIPCNDDSIRAIQVVLRHVIAAVEAGHASTKFDTTSAPEPMKKAAPAPAPEPAAAPAPEPAPEPEASTEAEAAPAEEAPKASTED